MKTRLISVACMLPFIIFLVLGGIPLLIITMLVSAAALFEYFKGFENLEIKASKPIAGALLLVLYGIMFGALTMADSLDLFNDLLGLWVFATLGVSLLLIILDKGHNILGPTYTMVGLIYIGYSIAHVYLLDYRFESLVWLPFIIAYLSDAGGFFAGMYFGKHRLSPALSPKKTIEGAIGGIIASFIGSVVFALIACQTNILNCIILGIIGGVIAELGDLTASAFKRKMGIKDYSSIIPGHGGVLDRIDSVIFVAPFVYYFAAIFFK